MKIPSSILLLALALPASAGFTPVLNLIEPRGGPRGAEVELHFYGERLDGLQELLQYQPGIEVRSIAVADDKNATAKVFIAPDAPLGEHGIRLRTTGGITFLRSFFVGQFPTVAEVDPNDTFEQAQRIELNSTVQGVSKAEDPDYYVCSLKKGQRLSAEVEAMRLGRTMFDAYVAILDPRGFEIASCDDAPLLRTDAFVSILAPEDGDYRVLVREAAYEGNDNCEYRLSIGTFPRPKAVFPTGAKPGETVEFRFIGDPAGDFTQTFTIPADAGEHYPLFPERDGLKAPSPHWIRVSPLASVNETEPNSGLENATKMPPLPAAAHGIIGENKDRDWYSFHAVKGENLTLKALARDLRSPLDPVLTVKNAKGENLANNDDQGGPDSIIQWTAPEEGDYFAEVHDQLERGGPEYTYRLEVLRREPAIAASLPVVERDNSQKWKVIGIPRGNRYAAVINFTRENVGGDLSLEAVSLPAGTTMQAPAIHRSVNASPVVFEAAADAPIAGALYAFKVHTTGDAPKVEGQLGDIVHHVEVNNQGPYHSATADRIPVAVIDEAPFKLELEQPVVPVVKNGTINLTVRAVRSEGYAEPINLRFLWNPPGIGSPANVTMNGDRSDAAYEINANGDAPPGEWKVCVLGEANTPKGPVLVSTALVTLRVAEPYLGLAMEIAATEQGKSTSMLAKLDQHTDFKGEATAELLGLPLGVTAPVLKFTREQTELTFPLTVGAEAPVGKHSGLFCMVVIPESGRGILHNVGQGGTLRIDKPAENAPAAPQPPVVAKTDQPAPPAEKPLSRLEQLRLKGK